MSKELIQKIRNRKPGEHLDLSYVYLRDADLSNSNLRDVNLSYANLRNANLSNADMSYANLSGSDMRNTNLSGSDMSYANLSGIRLNYCDGNGVEIKTIETGVYHVVIDPNQMAIGCKQCSFDEWWSFSDRDILEMEGEKALTFWEKWKPILEAMVEDE
jgi:uncharacterized protein YjbI with pentapeptide repeats